MPSIVTVPSTSAPSSTRVGQVASASKPCAMRRKPVCGRVDDRPRARRVGLDRSRCSRASSSGASGTMTVRPSAVLDAAARRRRRRSARRTGGSPRGTAKITIGDDDERREQRGDEVAGGLARAVDARGLGLAGGGLVRRLGPAELGDDAGSLRHQATVPSDGGAAALRRSARRRAGAWRRAATPRSGRRAPRRAPTERATARGSGCPARARRRRARARPAPARRRATRRRRRFRSCLHLSSAQNRAPRRSAGRRVAGSLSPSAISPSDRAANDPRPTVTTRPVPAGACAASRTITPSARWAMA